MFANLKNKLIEEVKASPSKFQQFANAAQAAVSSSTSTTPNSSDTNTTNTSANENFFSITEEDTPQNSPYKPLKLPSGASLRSRTSAQSLNNGSGGAIPRTRKLSNSSVASDVSFRLPSYDAPAMYHLHSDLDASGSELDDSASTTRLDVITKEQLYDAYKKSLDRYHKYRCRYTDLAKKYKDLERESSKARSVLVETQEKAIRRISELREQCTLEQQAKAHLEEALRMEMEDLNYKMQAYETKLQLLGENPENIKNTTGDNTSTNDILIDLTGNSVNDRVLLESEPSVEMQKKCEDLEQQLKELQEKHDAATLTIATLRKQEEENALLLAQTKQAIHTELEQKESEVNKLKNKLNKLEKDIGDVSKQETLLSDTEEHLKRIQSAKQESDAKLIATEHMLTQLKSDYTEKVKQLAALENQFKEYKNESEKSLEILRQQNLQLNEMLQNHQQKEISFAKVDNELNRTKNEKDTLQVALVDCEQKLKDMESTLQGERENIVELKNQISKFEQVSFDYDQQKIKMKNLEHEIAKLRANISNSGNEEIQANVKDQLEQEKELLNSELDAVKMNLEQKEKELKACNNKLNKQKKQYEQQQLKLNEQSAVLDQLKQDIADRDLKLDRTAQIEVEKNELKAQVTSILQEITNMQDNMRQVQQSHGDLEIEKRSLEAKIELLLKEQQNDVSVTEHVRKILQETEERAKKAEEKLDHVVHENTKLAEQNCLLEEQNNHLEKQLEERERAQLLEEASISDMRLKLQTAEDDLEKLNEKMRQVLDENSRMQNAQELMDHDYRTLQDKFDALEKEKLLGEDALKCAQMELETNVENRDCLMSDLLELRKAFEAKSNQLERCESERNKLQEEVSSLKEAETKGEQNKTLLEEAHQRNTQLKADLDQLTSNVETLELIKKENELLRSQKDVLQVELQEHVERVAELHTKISEYQALESENAQNSKSLEQYEEQLAKLQALIEESNLRSKILENESTELKSELNEIKAMHDMTKNEVERLNFVEKHLSAQLESSKANFVEQQATFETKCSNANADIERLHESNDALQLELDALKNKYQLQVAELHESLANREKQLQAINDKSGKMAEYDQLKIENEYLNKHVKQLESELEQFRESTQAAHSDSSDLKEKLKSLQCELYVLQENTERHEKQLKERDAACEQAKAETESMRLTLEEQTTELLRQTEHTDFITQQNDAIQKELLQTQQQLTETKQLLQQATMELQHSTETSVKLQLELVDLRAENLRNRETIETLNKDVNEINEELQIKKKQIDELQSEIIESKEFEKKIENNPLQKSSLPAENDVENSCSENINSQQEIDDLRNTNKQMADRINELERFRAGVQAQQLMQNTVQPTAAQVQAGAHGVVTSEGVDKAELEVKLKDIMNEVQDVNNRNLFLEQKCENYLILEQSNERLKLQNAKLTRQLDETLVSMHHSEGITANTEFEYLKNIMFQYLTGNANNETLVKVISAVLKFSPQQTQVALEKEHQRRSLLNKIL